MVLLVISGKETMRRVGIVCLVVGVLFARAAPALACSCVGPTPTRSVVPHDGASDFPIDGVVRVLVTGFPAPERAAIGAEYRLRDATGAVVALDVGVVATRIDLRPHTPLAPSATYTLEQIFAYDAAGTRLTDLQRITATGPLRGIWSPVATFTTATSPAVTRALVPTLTNARLLFRYGGGDCGPSTDVMTDLALPAGVIDTDVIELRTRHDGVVLTTTALGLASLLVGDTLCTADPVTLPSGSSIEVQAVLVDAAGHDLGTSGWRRARGHGTRPSSRRLTWAGWPSVTIVPTPSVSTSRGPASCPNGLEVISRHDVVSAGAPWMYGERTTLSSESATRFVAYGSDAGAMQLFTLAADGGATRIAPTATGQPDALFATMQGPIVTSVAYSRTLGVVGTLLRLDAHGAARWSSELPATGTDHRIARGGGQILVAWAATGDGITERLAYAIFDERTGALIESQAPTSFTLDANSEGPAAAFVDGRFVIVWGSAQGLVRGPLISLVVSAGGATHRPLSSIDSYSPPDLASAGNRAGLVTASSDGRVLFGVLDRDGALASGPFEVSVGVGGTQNRLPRVAWNGSELAVAWETYPTAGVYVAIADGTGAISAALRVDDAEPFAGSIGVTPTANGWLAGYTIDRGRGRIAELRCTSQPPVGPPQRIGAVP